MVKNEIIKNIFHINLSVRTSVQQLFKYKEVSLMFSHDNIALILLYINRHTQR